MRRVLLPLSAALLLSLLALPAAARVDGGCGNGQGWDLMPADAQALVDAYPSLARAIEDEFDTFESLVQQIDARDKNDNGWVCVKDPYAHSTGKSGGANAQSQGFYYFVNAVDDNPAP
jgi:hypothetical protein